MNQSHAWYALRRTLPPWNFEKLFNELLEYLPGYKVDELILKVDTEEFFHGQPDYDWVKAYQPQMFRLKKELDKLGIVYSVNPWITVGHCDRGRNDLERLPGLVTYVGHDGVECTSCACPLSSVWRENTSKVWTLYAETKPHIIWVEDDIRTFNHSPVEFGCFCDLHINKFSERIGRNVSREDLVSAILQPGTPHPWRSEYLDMQKDLMIDTVSFLAKTVHKVSPSTSLGLMSSGARSHCIEGRDWKNFSNALADGTPLYSRPPMGNYSESSLRGFYYSHDSIKLTRHCLPDAIDQTEVENVPFTRYANSVVFTYIEMAVSFAYGCKGVTMNLFDHCGTVMEIEPALGKMLAEKKTFLNSIAQVMQQSGVFKGVQLIHKDRNSHSRQLKSDDNYSALAENGYHIMEMFESLGIPTTYDSSDVIAVQGQTLRGCSDSEIKEILSRGLLIDADAATVLLELGYGKYIGLETASETKCIYDFGPFAAEEFFEPSFGGEDKKFLSLRLYGDSGLAHFSVMKINEKAKVLSAIVDADTVRHHPALYVFENELGGRVAVYACKLDTAYGCAFRHPFRKEQLENTVRWLSFDKFPLITKGEGVYPLSFRKDFKDFSVIGMFNFSLDPWEYAEFELHRETKPDIIEFLDMDGNWKKSEALTVKNIGENKYLLRYNNQVSFTQPFIMKMK